MTRLALALGLMGLALATGLIAYQGFAVVFAAVASAGFGLLLVGFFHLAPLTVNARAWQILIASRRRPSLARFIWATWLRESVNGLLPVARIGGEFVAVRFMIQHGLRTAPVVASVIVDMTLCVASQFAYTVLGLAIARALYGRSRDDDVRRSRASRRGTADRHLHRRSEFWALHAASSNCQSSLWRSVRRFRRRRGSARSFGARDLSTTAPSADLHAVAIRRVDPCFWRGLARIEVSRPSRQHRRRAACRCDHACCQYRRVRRAGSDRRAGGRTHDRRRAARLVAGTVAGLALTR